MVSSYEEILNKNSLYFQDRLKGLKDLNKQLYSAAEHFESSYEETDADHLTVIESSKDYVRNALVSTVDHLGSVAENLNGFLDEKTDEFSAASIRLSCIQQRLDTYQGLVDRRGVSQHSMMVEDLKHHKQYIIPSAESSHISKPKPMYRNIVSHKLKQVNSSSTKKKNVICNDELTHLSAEYNNPFAKSFQQSGTKPPLPRLRKKDPVNIPSRGILSNREQAEEITRKSSVSPLRSFLKRSGSVVIRSLSPSLSLNKRSSSVPRGAILEPEMTDNERETEAYTKRSKHLFKALLEANRSRKQK